ncbi:beta-lactamase/transpeptidase-like protein [Linnemannia elongata]|nr:beta-lactamase/transpeptidase-like protein [Linnemannia elongata]
MTNTTGAFQEWTDDIEKARANLGIQGMSVAVVRKGRITYAQGFGKRNDTDPFTPETIANIASMTKAFTAAAVGELIAENKATWDAPVSDYLPEFRLKDPRLTAEINFIDLLAHRTGYVGQDFEWYQRSKDWIELIKLLRYVDPVVPLRSKFIYTNTMYCVAGEAAGRIAGTSYEQVVHDKLFRPIGMQSTGILVEELVSRPNHALPYTAKSFEALQRGETLQVPLKHYPIPTPASGEIYSNVIDLAKWANVMLHGGQLNGVQVLHKETVERVTTACIVQKAIPPRDPDSSISAYGMGWFIEQYKGHHTVLHGGQNPGYRCNMVLFPHDDLAVIVLSNTLFNELTGAIPYYIADRVLSLPKTKDWLFEVAVQETRDLYKIFGADNNPEMLDSLFPPRLQHKPPTRLLENFAGEYTHPYAQKILIRVEPGTNEGDGAPVLACKLGAFDRTLEHYHYDSFRLQLLDNLIDDTFAYPLLLTFIAGHDGFVIECRVLMLGKEQVFTKVQPNTIK